jgi:CRP/FNR family transcriptional regulator, anaerobic regulatory protein
LAPIANPKSSFVPEPAGVESIPPSISVDDLRAHCLTCSVRELCLPVGLTPDGMKQVDGLIVHRTRIKKHQDLYRAGDPFHALYAIRVGSVKAMLLSEDGREQVMGFHMPGEILGLDGVGTNHHETVATALEDTEVCVIPFANIQGLARRLPELQQNLHQIMSKEIMRDQGMMLLIGSMNSEERLAVFLLNLAERYRRRGFSSTEFVLRMTREEIASYLGLKLETVSRLLSRFQEGALIQVQGRTVKLLDPIALRQLVGKHV